MAEAKRGRPAPGLSESEIIARYFAPLAEGTAESLGLEDDAALLPQRAKSELVVTTDTIVEGTHFRSADAPADIGYKALAVNVSDLTAKGAAPYCYLLSLVLPHADADWLSGFSSGLGEAQAAFGCHLVGGDTTSGEGPVTISLTALGDVPPGQMVRRAGAVAGDRLYVSGTIGDAALGLMLGQKPQLAEGWGLEASQIAYLENRYRRPAPPIAIAPLLRTHATAALDISDGLMGDAAKLCLASDLAGEIASQQVPLSEPARKALGADPSLLEAIMTGGDDYQVMAAIPDSSARAFEEDAAKAGVRVAAIGHLSGGEVGVGAIDGSGQRLQFSRLSFDHFT